MVPPETDRFDDQAHQHQPRRSAQPSLDLELGHFCSFLATSSADHIGSELSWSTVWTLPWQSLERHDRRLSKMASRRPGSLLWVMASINERDALWQCRHSRLLYGV